MFSLGDAAVPRGYFRNGCLDADGPAGGRVGFLIAISVVVRLGSGSGRFGIRDSAIGRSVCCIGSREVCSWIWEFHLSSKRGKP